MAINQAETNYVYCLGRYTEALDDFYKFVDHARPVTIRIEQLDPALVETKRPDLNNQLKELPSFETRTAFDGKPIPSVLPAEGDPIIEAHYGRMRMERMLQLFPKALPTTLPEVFGQLEENQQLGLLTGNGQRLEESAQGPVLTAELLLRETAPPYQYQDTLSVVIPVTESTGRVAMAAWSAANKTHLIMDAQDKLIPLEFKPRFKPNTEPTITTWRTSFQR